MTEKEIAILAKYIKLAEINKANRLEREREKVGQAVNTKTG